MRLTKKKKFDYIDVIANILMILFSICILYPMLHVVAVSFSGKFAILRNEVTIFPVDFTLESYTYFMDHQQFLRGFINAVWYTFETIVAHTCATALMAYPMSKNKLFGRSVIMRLCVFTMYFSGGLIPLFMQINRMGLYGSEWSWILADLVSTYNMIIMINAYRSVPDSLYEAAYLDGASEFQVFFKIALPLTKASLATISLFTFISSWNSWYHAMLYLDDPQKFPLQLFLRSVLIENKETDQNPNFNQNLTPIGVKNSLVVLTMIPVMVVYPIVQKHFVKGVMIGSVKG